MPELEIYKKFNVLGFQSTTFSKYRNLICFNFQDVGKSAAFFDTRTGNLALSDAGLDSLNVLFSNSVFENDGKLTMIPRPQPSLGLR